LFGGEDQCPEWMVRGLAMVIAKPTGGKDEGADENEPPEDYPDAEGQLDSDEGNRNDAPRPSEQDEIGFNYEMRIILAITVAEDYDTKIFKLAVSKWV